jgi:hypothetical protein
MIQVCTKECCKEFDRNLWLTLHDKEPAAGQIVLFCIADKEGLLKTVVGVYCSDSGFLEFMGAKLWKNIPYWMPLPEPPSTSMRYQLILSSES